MNKDQKIASLEQMISVYEGNLSNAKIVMQNQGDKIASLTRSIVTFQGMYEELLNAAIDVEFHSEFTPKYMAAQKVIAQHSKQHNQSN